MKDFPLADRVRLLMIDVQTKGASDMESEIEELLPEILTELEFWNNRRETLLKVLDMLEHIRPLVLSLEVLKDVRDRKQ